VTETNAPKEDVPPVVPLLEVPVEPPLPLPPTPTVTATVAPGVKPETRHAVPTVEPPVAEVWLLNKGAESILLLKVPV
jgi:hypothetical protein